VTIRRAAAATAITFVLVFLPAIAAEASTEIDSVRRERQVVIPGVDGRQHTCYLTFGLIEVWGADYHDSASAETVSDSDVSTPGGADPACADATVEVTLRYTTNSGDHVHTVRRTGPYPSPFAVFAAAYVEGQSELDANGQDTGFTRLSSSHRVYFPACDCSFTETLVRRK
jgi:hypothetical protein